MVQRDFTEEGTVLLAGTASATVVHLPVRGRADPRGGGFSDSN